MVLLVGCAATPPLEGFPTEEVQVGDHELTVAVAETSDQRSQGLRGVDELPSGIDGMLFVFGEPRTASFGMRDTQIPLEIWWFDGDGLLLGSAEMEPCESVTCTSYGSPGEVAWALETPAGAVALAPGDVLTVPSGS